MVVVLPRIIVEKDPGQVVGVKERPGVNVNKGEIETKCSLSSQFTVMKTQQA